MHAASAAALLAATFCCFECSQGTSALWPENQIQILASTGFCLTYNCTEGNSPLLSKFESQNFNRRVTGTRVYFETCCGAMSIKKLKLQPLRFLLLLQNILHIKVSVSYKKHFNKQNILTGWLGKLVMLGWDCARAAYFTCVQSCTS